MTTTTTRSLRNIPLLYLTSLFMGLGNCWAPIMVLYQLQLIGMSMTQVMLGEAAFAASLVLLEVPTGIVADKYGRRTSLLLGRGIHAIGILLFALSQSFGGIILSQVIAGLGLALESGADDALL
ncbi:hypothetical protein H6771_03045 [Candidatus Peribacteria bacterium]|nr:hypothetical protein [Candidatus Peribacteria bacterium]